MLGDSEERLKELDDNSIDSIVTDPPYGISMMNKGWDYQLPSIEIWKECLRVLKPGGYILAFSSPRTYHRLVVSIEDAGFEIRDCIMWVYGSGFPKSLNIGKKLPDWEGFGTNLKPSHEPIVMARKPISEKTIAANVLKWGTGAINIDGCRVSTDETISTHSKKCDSDIYGDYGTLDTHQTEGQKLGRFPANFIHDGSQGVLDLFPDAKGGTWNTTSGARHFNNDGEPTDYKTSKSDSSVGSAARFFYCAKASKKDRNAGCENNNHPTVKPTELMTYLCRLVTPSGGVVLDPFLGSGSTGKAAVQEGFNFVGIELDKDYLAIAEQRINN